MTTEIDNASLLVKPEMTGNAKIFCGKRRIFHDAEVRPLHPGRVLVLVVKEDSPGSCSDTQ